MDKNHNNELQKLQAQLRQSRRMEAVGHLMGGVAHDFNDLLAIIQSNVDVLELKVGEDDLLGPRLATIEQAVDRGSAITSRLLAFSRKQAHASEAVNIGELATSLRSEIEELLSDQVELVIEVEERPCFALVDPGHLARAFKSLAANSGDAIKESGKVTISVGLTTLDADYVKLHRGASTGKFVEIIVRDNGAGMPPDSLARAFEPFYTTKTMDEDAGLGLSMVYGFVKQSYGYIDLTSETGTGTNAHMFLPVYSGGHAK
jgi:signal transduction histidine kinase